MMRGELAVHVERSTSSNEFEGRRGVEPSRGMQEE